MNYYVLNNNEKIYPLLRIEYEGNNYLLYSNKEINLTKDDIYVGEEKNEQLLPVKNELLPILEEKFEEIVRELTSIQATEEL